MEEKERYEIKDRWLVDTQNNYKQIYAIDSYIDRPIIDLLNRQDKRIKELEQENLFLKEQNQQLKQQIEELKGKRLEFYNDDVRQTQVINGVHFDIEQLLIFSEYVEHEKNISADKDKQINQLKQQFHDLPKNIVEEIRKAIFEECREYYYAEENGIIQYTEITPKKVNRILDIILKKYGGENESVCD